MSVPTTAEVDELASLLGEEIPTEEQELDWQSDLFATEAEEVEALPEQSS